MINTRQQMIIALAITVIGAGLWFGVKRFNSSSEQTNHSDVCTSVLPEWDRNARAQAVSRTTGHQLKTYALEAALVRARTQRDSIAQFIKLVAAKDSVIKAVEAERDALLAIVQ